MRQSRHLGLNVPLKQWFHKMPRQTYGADDSGTIKPIKVHGTNITVLDSTSELDEAWGTIVIGFHGGAAIPIKLNEVSPKLKYGNSIKFSLCTMWAGNYGGTDDCTKSFFCAVVKDLNKTMTGDNVIFNKQELHTIVTVNNQNVSAHMFKELEPEKAAGSTDNVYIGYSPRVSELNNTIIEQLKKIKNFFHPKKDKKFFSAKDGTIYLLVWGEPYGRENYHLRPTKYKRTTRIMNTTTGKYDYTYRPGQYVTVGEPTGVQVSVGYLAARPYNDTDWFEDMRMYNTNSSSTSPSTLIETTTSITIPILGNIRYRHPTAVGHQNIWYQASSAISDDGTFVAGIGDNKYISAGIPFSFNNINNYVESINLKVKFSYAYQNPNYTNSTYCVAISTTDMASNQYKNDTKNYINGSLYLVLKDENELSGVDSNNIFNDLEEGFLNIQFIELNSNIFNTNMEFSFNINKINPNKQYYLYIFTANTNTQINSNFHFRGNVTFTLTYNKQGT